MVERNLMCEMFKWYSLQYEFINATGNGKNTLGVLGLKDILGVNPTKVLADRQRREHIFSLLYLASL